MKGNESGMRASCLERAAACAATYKPEAEVENCGEELVALCFQS